MDKYAKRIYAYLTKQEKSNTQKNKPAQIIAEIPRQLVPSSLQAATAQISAEPRGYIISEFLQEPVRNDDKLYQQLVDFLLSPGEDLSYRYLLLHFLKSQSRHNKTRGKTFSEAMCKIANSNTQQMTLRATALRSFYPHPVDEGLLLVKLLEKGSPLLVDAVAHIIAYWSKQNVTIPDQIKTLITQYALSNIATIAEQPGTLMALTQFDTKESNNALNQLIIYLENKPVAQARVLQAIGAQLSIGLLARLMKYIMQSRNDSTRYSLRIMFNRDASRLQSLRKEGYYKPYLYGLLLAPNALDKKGFNTLLHNYNYISSFKDNKPSRISPASKYIYKNISIPNRDTKVIEQSFNTGFHKADALYRDLDSSLTHWHVALYCGYDREAQKLKVIHVTGELWELIGNSDVVKTLTQEIVLDKPEQSVREEFEYGIKKLLANFLTENNLIFHGPRRIESLPSSKADDIVETAERMVGRGIEYTGTNMLDPKGPGFSSWDGTIDDIENLRCDGLVEYCYEKNGQRVCDGADANHGNISEPGRDSINSHEDFHNGEYQHGELCPRIQAGSDDNPDENHADVPITATHLTTGDQPSPPNISAFEIFPWIGSSPPCIHFKIEANRYDQVYVRITVIKDGNTYFIQSDTFSGWEKRNTSQDYIVDWLGKAKKNLTTEEMEDFRNNAAHGDYEFQIVAVDLAGNVSELLSQTINIVWCEDSKPTTQFLDIFPEQLAFHRSFSTDYRTKKITIRNNYPCQNIEVSLQTNGKPFYVSQHKPTETPTELSHVHDTIPIFNSRDFWVTVCHKDILLTEGIVKLLSPLSGVFPPETLVASGTLSINFTSQDLDPINIPLKAYERLLIADDGSINVLASDYHAEPFEPNPTPQEAEFIHPLDIYSQESVFNSDSFIKKLLELSNAELQELLG